MNAIVTGGGGFLGSRIVGMLCNQGHRVTALGRSDYPFLRKAGISTIQADVRNLEALKEAFQGIDTVFHTAAITAIWGSRKRLESINVDGTRNVIAACRTANVRKLIYTSSPSVIFDGRDLCGVDESMPYPNRYLAHYPRTKALAERMILAANSPELATIVLRPHLIWGPGDPHLIPRVIDRARRGKLVQIGDGRNRVDITYIDNAASAHVLAAESLSAGSHGSGNAYFISQGEPVELWPWLTSLLQKVGAPPPRRTMSLKSALRAGLICELTYKALRITHEPPMTRFLATQLSKSHYFDISAAKRDFGYTPEISMEKGLALYLENMTNMKHQPSSTRPAS